VFFRPLASSNYACHSVEYEKSILRHVRLVFLASERNLHVANTPSRAPHLTQAKSRQPLVLKLPFFLIPRSGLPLRVAGAGAMQGITSFARRTRRIKTFERSVLLYVSIKNLDSTQSGGKRRILRAAHPR
jgi:hypothetical protein